LKCRIKNCDKPAAEGWNCCREHLMQQPFMQSIIGGRSYEGADKA